MKRWAAATITLTSAAMLVGSVLLPGDAQAGTLLSFGTCASGPQAGQISISLLTYSPPLSSMTVSLMSGNQTELTFNLSDFQETQSLAGDESEVWSLSTPITQDQLALGSYTVNVSATDGMGTATATDLCTFSFLTKTAITLSPDVTSISYNGQDVTLTGSLTGTQPGGTPQPLAGEPVTIQGIYPGEPTYATVDTGPDGSFSAVVPATVGQSVEAEFAGTATIAPAESGIADFVAALAQTNLAATANVTKVDYGSGQVPVTISGTLTFLQGSAWQPLPGQPITIIGWLDSSSNRYISLSVVTAADGSFTAKLPNLPATTDWLATFAGNDDATTPAAPFASLSVAAGTVAVRLPLTVTGFKASVNSFGIVSVSGCVANASPDAPAVTEGPVLVVDYAAGAGGPWRKLGTVDASRTACTSPAGGAGEHFAGTMPAALAAAYYRISFAGDSQYVPATSAAVRAAKYRTRFVDFAVTPHTLRSGHKITVIGKLQSLAKSWTGLPGVVVQIIYSVNGGKTWHLAYRVRTGAAGKFTKQFKVYGTAIWSADFNGNATHYVTGAATVRVRVTS